jgi:hypothetical protein
MAELYTVMRYMALKALEKDNIAAFDAWANMFGEVAPGYERNAAGGYEIVERFSKFVNVPELMKRVRGFMDVLTSAELGDLVTRPKMKGGGPQNVITPQSEALEHYMKGELDERLKTSREWKPSKEQPGNPDPVINIITDARLSSIDMRFVSTGRRATRFQAQPDDLQDRGEASRVRRPDLHQQGRHQAAAQGRRADRLLARWLRRAGRDQPRLRRARVDRRRASSGRA